MVGHGSSGSNRSRRSSRHRSDERDRSPLRDSRRSSRRNSGDEHRRRRHDGDGGRDGDGHSPPPYTDRHRHHRRSATEPMAIVSDHPRVRRSPSTIHPTLAHIRDFGGSILGALFDSKDKRRRDSHGHRESEHHSERASQRKDVPYEEREERIEHAEHQRRRRRKHRVPADKGRRNTLDGADIITTGYAPRDDHRTYQSARDIIDELMDDYNVTARQIVLRLIPELRYLLTEEEDRHAARGSWSELGEGKESQQLTMLFRELKLCFVNLDGRDCRALVEYTIARERDIGESYSSDDEGEGGSIAPSEPTMFEGPISEAPSQIGAPR